MIGNDAEVYILYEDEVLLKQTVITSVHVIAMASVRNRAVIQIKKKKKKHWPVSCSRFEKKILSKPLWQMYSHQSLAISGLLNTKGNVPLLSKSSYISLVGNMYHLCNKLKIVLVLLSFLVPSCLWAKKKKRNELFAGIDRVFIESQHTLSIYAWFTSSLFRGIPNGHTCIINTWTYHCFVIRAYRRTARKVFRTLYIFHCFIAAIC